MTIYNIPTLSFVCSLIFLSACTQRPPSSEPTLMSIESHQGETEDRDPTHIMSMMEENTQQISEQGLTLHLQTRRKSKLSSLQLWIKAGSQLESKTQRGVAYLTLQMILDTVNGQQSVRDQLQDLGVEIRSWVTKDRTVIDLLCLSKHVEKVMPLLYQAITQPQWDQQQFSVMKKKLINQVQSQTNISVHQRFNQLLHLAYRDHPNAQSTIIDANLLKALHFKDVQTFYQQYYHPNRSHLIYIGALSKGTLETLVSSSWKTWSKDTEVDTSQIEQFNPPANAQIEVDMIDHNIAQIQLAFPLVDMTPERVAYLDLLVLLLLGEQDGLLYQKAEKVGVDIKRAYIFPMVVDGPGQLIMHIEVSTRQVDEMWSVLLEQLKTLGKHSISLRTLELAKTVFEQKKILKTSHISQYSKHFAFFTLRWPNSDALVRYKKAIYQTTPQVLRQYLSQLFVANHLSAVIRSTVPDKVDKQLWEERFNEQLKKIMQPQKINYHQGFTALGSNLGILFHPMPNSPVIRLQALIPLKLPYYYAYHMSLGHWMAAQMSLHQAHGPYYESTFHAHAMVIETTVTHSQLEEALSGMIQRIRQTPIQSEVLWSSHFLEQARMKALQNLRVLHQQPRLKLGFLERKAKLALNQQPLIDLKSRIANLQQQSSSELIRWYTKNIQFAPALLTILGDIKESKLNRTLDTFASLKDDENLPLSEKVFTKVTQTKTVQNCRWIHQIISPNIAWSRQSYIIEQNTLKTYAVLTTIASLLKHKTLRTQMIEAQMPQSFHTLLTPLDVQMNFMRDIPSFDIITHSASQKHVYTSKSVETLLQTLQQKQISSEQLKQLKQYTHTLQTIKLSHPTARLQWINHLWVNGIRSDIGTHLQQWHQAIEQVTAEDIKTYAQSVFQSKNMIQALISPPLDLDLDTCKKINL